MRLRPAFFYGLLALPSLLSLALYAADPAITVFKTATCGCCGKWVEHLKANGFQVTVNEVPDTGEYRRKYGVPDSLASCHTAVVEGYAIEGHVPAAEIHRLLKERPTAKGLAVPGMPMGAPGMEGSRSDKFEVLLFDATGRTTVYKEYPGN
jgi:hypothetical protein